MSDNYTGYSHRDLPLEKVDELIASSRNVFSRTRKACYPCNKRKVRCDREQHQPCTNCSKRSHPDLCFFEPELAASVSETPRKRKLESQGQDAVLSPLGPGSGPRAPTHSPTVAAVLGISSTRRTEDSLIRSTLRTDVDTPDSASPTSGHHPHQNNTVPSVYRESPDASRDSMTALVQDRAYDSPQMSSLAIQPLFGLRDTTAPYPFVDSDNQSMWSRVTSLLPDQDDILKFFHVWRSVHSPFQTIISDVDALEIQVCNFLEDLEDKSVQSRIDSVQGSEVQKELAWLGLLLSILALGAQCSDHPIVQRAHISQKYTRNAFELLRLANFLSRPSEAAIQTLLLLGIVLQNDFQPDAAWALIGTTIRLAQSLSLDRSGHRTCDLEQTRSTKQKLWWAVVWQETLLSMCFGRPSSLYTGLGDPPIASHDGTAKFGFAEAMYALIKIVGDTLDPSLFSNQMNRVTAALLKIEDLDAKVSPRLVCKARCRNLGDRLDMHAFCIHRNFVASYLLQLAIRNSGDLEEKKNLIKRCRVTSSKAARAFVDLASFSVLPLRFWSYLHNALGSILLRGFLGEFDGETRNLQRDLLNVLRKADRQSGRIGSKVLERHSDALATLETMYQRSSSVHVDNIGRAAGSRNQSVSIDQSEVEEEFCYDPMIWMQPDGTMVDPDDIWSSYFANPLLQGNELSFIDPLQPES